MDATTQAKMYELERVIMPSTLDLGLSIAGFRVFTSTPPTRSSTRLNMAFSDETKDRVNAAIGIAKTIITIGWIPAIIFIGYRNSNPQPSLIKLITPLA
ncbi:hypothetical protein CC85DRAFT_47530 [Cutaneotrichosporon oleaginosum]|uniref:Tom7-domain-containing protein n=1 Tax=Cutaneotrichosporon oleaginosum TaxID=879819 RepID=A0A0J0XQX1_9TREE|nr:uncharacterized protein CC85DRAFT_47530 [Cutaneotrichosporon oleaginosum]KLT43475.1 hypothetical protein CC85DRAFT_47530 [Cutaneotrichosporon oleaginosum]